MPATRDPSELAAGAPGRIGAQLRTYRKALHISATAAAEAAGISRVTLHRLEKGEASVAIGAYIAVAAALGLTLQLAGETLSSPAAGPGWIPSRVPVADYPQLARLAWQIGPTTTLTPREAFDIYERNSRHLDRDNLSTAEQDLIAALRAAFDAALSHDV